MEKTQPETKTMAGGRPSKLNDELCQAICKNISQGNTLTYSVQKEGLSYQSFLNWMKKGEESKTQSGKFFEFFEAIKKAQEEGKNSLVTGIREHGKKNWQAMAWLLERMYPNEFGRRENVKMEHKGKLKTENTHEITVKSNLERLKRIERDKENDSDNTRTDL
jgi:transposase